jgi:hypothetical protein
MKQMLPNLRIMKRIIPIIAIAIIFAACNSKPEVTPAQVQGQQQVSTMSPEDSLVLSQFRAWKAQNELSDAQAFLNGGQNPNTQTNSNTSSPTRSSSSTRRSTSTRSTGTSSTSTQTAKKKGWSSAAKGAVIGGVAGAAGGAVINKRNRAAGAVIGGILGAGVGYGIGRSKDVKSGRAN